jgi:hypothetical protein
MTNSLNVDQVAQYGVTAVYLESGFNGALKVNWPGTTNWGLFPQEYGIYYASGSVLGGDFVYNGVSDLTAQNIWNIFDLAGTGTQYFWWEGYSRWDQSGDTYSKVRTTDGSLFTTRPDMNAISITAPAVTVDMSNTVLTYQGTDVVDTYSAPVTFTFLPGVTQSASLSYSYGTTLSTQVTNGVSWSTALGGSVSVSSTQSATGDAIIAKASATMTEQGTFNYTHTQSYNYSDTQTNTTSTTQILTLMFNPGTATPNSSGEYIYTNSAGDRFSLIPNQQYEVFLTVDTQGLLTPIPNTFSITSGNLQLTDNMYGTENTVNQTFLSAFQKAVAYGYNNLAGFDLSDPTLISYQSSPQAVIYYGLINGLNQSSFDGSITVLPVATSSAIQSTNTFNVIQTSQLSNASTPDALKSGLLDLKAIATTLSADKGMVLDFENIWVTSDVLPEIVNISGGAGHVVRAGDANVIVSTISKTSYQGNGNTSIWLDKLDGGNYFQLGEGNDMAVIKSNDNNLFLGAGCNYTKIESTGTNYIVLNQDESNNYIELNSVSGDTVISGWDATRDHLSIGSNIDQSSISVVFNPTTYIYTISAGANKIATIISNSKDADLAGNIGDVNLLNIKLKNGQLSDYALINLMYGEFLGRAPDTDGFFGFVSELKKYETPVSIAETFIRSSEYQNRLSNTSDFLDALYHDVLSRSADTGGKDSWMSQIEKGMSRSSVAEAFLHSSEYISLVGLAASEAHT